MSDQPPPPTELIDAARAAIVEWLATELGTNPVMAAVSPDGDVPDRWHVRVLGEEKDVYTIRLTLRQRTLHAETYVLPAPVHDPAAAYEYALRRNLDLDGLAFAIGEEDALFLVTELPVEEVSARRLDELLGAFWMAVERSFRALVRLAFG